MKQIIVGTYKFGYGKVQVVLTEGTRNSFYLISNDVECPKILIGADIDNYDEILVAFLHECNELALAKLNCRYYPEENVSRDIYAYHFFMDHVKFSDMNAMTAEILAVIWNDLFKCWKEWKGFE